MGSGLYKSTVEVSIPRFRTEWGTDLKDVLVKKGMEKAFEPKLADLSGVDGTKDLFVYGVAHKAYVDVNEEGTEAAGATGVVTVNVSVPRQIVADHPFFFGIRDVGTGIYLFLGRLADPKP
jgi:serpin B